ncbi:AroM family protein [Salipiger sp. P9]|uniref:AroM family protein n=1 Tax=Salipiger pentaromativorans TaxID=2943193 RepID=UPI00215875A5|nr:AroM family protein [Salipiger pentaromativorans]MCR8546919.1 AroM family protein [Salipiger pentaromativorans]
MNLDKAHRSVFAQDRPALPRVLFLTVGRSPRQDILPEILNILDIDLDVVELGVLDDLSAGEIEEILAHDGEESLSTYLSENIRVVLSKAAVRRKLERILDEIQPYDCDLVVLLSTGLLRDFQSPRPMVNAQRAVESAIIALGSNDQTIGLIHPLERQVGEIDIPVLNQFNVTASHAREGDRDSLARAVMDVADSDVIVLHSVSYTEADREIVAQASRKPVLLARRIIATAIRLMLQQAPLRSGPALSAETRRRLERLTPRERQVATLVCEGLPNKVIAAQLGISQKTVEVHRANVMSKTGASSLGGLIHMMLGITPSTLSI